MKTNIENFSWIKRLYNSDEIETVENFLSDIKEAMVDEGMEPTVTNAEVILEQVLSAKGRR